MEVAPSDEVPVRALRVNTRKILSDMLNAKKIFRSRKGDGCREGYIRDWRGLAHLCSVDIPNQENLPKDPTEFVLLEWQKKENPTIGQLLGFLERINRYDVIDDTEELIRKDVERYLHLKDSVGEWAVQEAAIVNHDQHILTTDDVCRMEVGLGPQMYDAFVMFAEEEWEGARVIVDYLESENFKLCLKDRDIVAGISFEHKAIMTLIQQRCHRLIVLLSPKFVEDHLNNFSHLFAQSVAIEKQTRKVIPCIYKEFPSRDAIPSEFLFYKCLRFSDMNRWAGQFWKQLKDSIVNPDYVTRINGIQQNGVVLREVSNEIQPALPVNRIIPAILPDNVQVANNDSNIIRSCNVIEDSMNVVKDSTIRGDNVVEDSPIRGKRKSVLGLKLRSAFQSMSKTFSKGWNRNAMNRVGKRCPVMA